MSRLNSLHIFITFLLFNKFSRGDELDISKIVDCAKHIIENGIPALNIPQFADIYIDEMNIFVPIPMIKGDYNFSKFHLFGLSDFDMTVELELYDGMVVNVDFQIHGIQFQTEYSFASRWIGTVDLKGVGVIEMDLPIRFKAEIKLGEEVDVKIIPSANPRIDWTGLSVGERVTKLIGKQMASLIEAVITNEELTNALNALVKFIVGSLLNAYIELPDDFIEIIKNECNLSEDFSRLERYFSEKQRESFKFKVKDDL